MSEPTQEEIDAAYLARDLAVTSPNVEARRHAYKAVFGSAAGRFVLADILQDAGAFEVAQPGEAMSPDMRAFLNGRAAQALQIADLAGFSAQSLVVALMTRFLERQDHAQPTDAHDDEYPGVSPLGPE